MEYGLRRYEASQRLLSFLFFIFCLVFAYSLAGDSVVSRPLSAQAPVFQPEGLKSFAFWTHMQWIRVEPFGKYMIYVVWVLVLFLAGRTCWLLIQHIGMFLVKRLLSVHVKKPVGRPKPGLMAPSPERLFPAELLMRKVSPLPLQLIFHPYQRLGMMLNHPQGSYSSEELSEKERRIVETDWQILWGSWTPFRWLVWCLPLLGLLEAAWLFYQQLQPAFQGLKELHDVLSRVLNGLLPLAQSIVIALAFGMVSGLLKRVENLYLSSVDALIYDQFLSCLPFQSSDTLILLETMQRHFQELQRMMRRLERLAGGERGPEGARD